MLSPVAAVPDGTAQPGHREIGGRLRSARESLRLSTRDVAARAGVSAGFISQLENGKTGVSISVLKRIAVSLGVSVAEILAEEAVTSRSVLRAHERSEYVSEEGTTKYLLSRLPLSRLEVYEGVFEVDGSTGELPYAHDDAQEIFYVLSGHVEITVGPETNVLGPRDSLEYRSSVPHRTKNVGATRAEVLWIAAHVTPPARIDSPASVEGTLQ